MIVPKLETEIEDKITRKIYDVVEEYNLNWQFVLDSRAIKEAIASLSIALHRIKVEAKPQYDKETLKEMNELKQGREKKK